MNNRAVALAFLVIACCAASGRAELVATTLDKPLAAQVTLAEGNERVAGNVVRYDADTVVFKTAKGERELKWGQLSAGSQYAVRVQVIEKKTAGDWLGLAELAMQLNLKEQAKNAVAQAGRLDPATKLKGDAILRGQGAAKPVSGAATSGSAVETERYQKATPEQAAKAMEAARKEAADRKAELKMEWREFETAHFLVFTNWPVTEDGFLKENLEGAYAAVSKQFDIPVSENVFVGKLPIYMLEKKEQFEKFALADGGIPSAAGYYQGWSDGHGHMVMSKPDVKKYGREAPVVWARILTHEFTHAFVARYRTNRHIPRWLNEGVAEVIALGQFPNPYSYERASEMASERFNFDEVFDEKAPVNFKLYPVYHTTVEALAREDRKAFLAMFNDIKDGMGAEDALQKNFKVGYSKMEAAWRAYVKKPRR